MNDIIQLVANYIFAPIAGVIWYLYRGQQEHRVDIAVLKSRLQSDKQAHDREIAEIRETTNKIFAKLDSIEGALRK